jgi:hypothetical protein
MDAGKSVGVPSDLLFSASGPLVSSSSTDSSVNLAERLKASNQVFS